jgi:hypothetical protein
VWWTSTTQQPGVLAPKGSPMLPRTLLHLNRRQETLPIPVYCSEVVRDCRTRWTTSGGTTAVPPNPILKEA